MAVQHKPFYTPEEYLALEREAETKSEYLAGQIFAMAGASPEHNQIAFNLITLIGAQLRGGPCRGYTSDQRVLVSSTGLYTYPDVSVVCGNPQYTPNDPEALVNPSLIIEVLSDSTEGYDRGEKFAHYDRVESLSEFVLVAQNMPRIECFVRQESGKWLLDHAEGLDASLPLVSIPCELKLADVYNRVEFPSPEELAARRRRSHDLS